MQITEKENLLFERWRLNRAGFVADGVANETEYLKSNKKILFIMKEVNDPGGGGWDLRSFMREGARPKTWDNIARWIEGIRSSGIDFEWNDMRPMSLERRIKSIQTVAAINIKKSPGGHTTDKIQLSKIAYEDKIYLNEQMKIYSPDYVICCGTDVSNFIFNNIDLYKKSSWKHTKHGIGYKEYECNKYVICYIHPEARVPDSMIYYGLIDAVKEIEKKCWLTGDQPDGAVVSQVVAQGGNSA